MVEIADRVLARWRAVSAEDSEAAMVLIFRSALPPDEAVRNVAESAGDAIQELELEYAATRGAEWSTGHWSAAVAPGGAVLRIDEEPDEFERLVGLIASGLEARGVEGFFDLYESSTAPQLAEVVDLFECRIRVGGERYRRPNGRLAWRADSELMTVGVASAVRWCVANGPELPRTLTVRLVAPVLLSPDDDALAFVNHGLEQAANLGVVKLTSVAPDRFRVVAFSPRDGRISFIEGGEALAGDGWQATVANLQRVLRGAAVWAAYAFVKRGSLRVQAELGDSLWAEWFSIPHYSRTLLMADVNVPFEDTYAPDAFGLQLLGPGYEGRGPTGSAWKTTATASPRAVLVEHGEPVAWFAAPLGPPTLFEPAPAPSLVESARTAFDAILFREEIAAQRDRA